MDSSKAARIEAAKRKVKRASGLLRDAARELAAAGEDHTTVGTVHVANSDQARDADSLIAIGLARYGAVDVVVLARHTDHQAR